jgi:hypothetical protein
MHETVPVRFSRYAGMDVGRENGLPVDSEPYGNKAPFPFSGIVTKVVFDLAAYPKESDRKALHEAHQQALVGRGVSG